MDDNPTRRLDEGAADPEINRPTTRLAAPLSPRSTCTECGGAMIEAEFVVEGRTGTTQVFVRRSKSNPRLFSAYNLTECLVLVCLECVYTKLYTQAPELLME